MVRISFAPVLSATLSRDSCCITCLLLLVSLVLIPWLGRALRNGHGNYSCCAYPRLGETYVAGLRSEANRSHSAFEPGPRHVGARRCADFSSDARWMAEL